jgi:serine/threonine protein kinase
MSTPQYTLLQPDGDLLRAPVVGRGGTAVTVPDGDTALKLPLKYGLVGADGTYVEQDDATAEMSYECLQREKKVYQRLEQHDDIVACLDISGVGITLALMENGDLQDYLDRYRDLVDESRQLSWFRAMARALVHVHDRRVLAADIATRNFLLNSDLDVKLSDFNQSTILPLDADMETVDDYGYSIYTDIGQLGTVFYTVATGQACEFDLFKDLPYEPTDAIWPKRKDLPGTENIWIGPIIERCWTKSSFRNAQELLDALNSFKMNGTGITIESHL